MEEKDGLNPGADILRLKGIGQKTAGLFYRLGVGTVGELLHFYPRDYEAYEETVPLAGAAGRGVCAVRGMVSSGIAVKRVRNLSVANFVIRDGTGQVQMTYFNMPYLKNTLRQGRYYVFRGLVQEKNGRLVMEQARIYQEGEYYPLMNTLQPRYPLTGGLTNNAVMKAVKQALALCPPEEEYLPEDIRGRVGLCGLEEAVKTIHFPVRREELEEARRRLAFDEFFLFLLALNKVKEHNEAVPNTHRMIAVAETGRLIESLPYALTGAQRRIWEEIQEDLAGESAMSRMIQGDVGSGKTILALLALLMAAANGFQGAMMAPTEVLAEQHAETIRGMTERYGLPLRPVLLTGSMSAGEKREACRRIDTGEANVIIGTHALIQERVAYRDLALVVTDEQHRFGVRQREALAGKGENVHVLVMSATPIPRSLAIILYGDLALSVLDERPAERLPVKNCVVGTKYREKAYRFIASEVEKGRQAYVVCPMVEEGELDGVENVADYAGKLRSVLPEKVRLCCLHGKMKPAEKNRIMEEFAAGNIDVLVSTTVIEVGIDVANATVMMVENAERFGLAQLHQLRGRVGRGEFQSYCILVNTSDREDAGKRLEILNRSNDGFFIAREDMRLRGPGDLFGIRQSGILDFKIGDIYQDGELVMAAEESVKRILTVDGELSLEENAPLKRRLERELTGNSVNSVDFRSI